jgi:2-oxoisovalerate dehydrogenase E2 component (dihydrolipoyl transacylase)
MASPTPPTQFTPFTPVQKAMFKSMTASLSIPHFTLSEDITLTNASQLRAQINAFLKSNKDVADNYGIEKMSYMPIFIKALAMAVEDIPAIRARVMEESAEGVKGSRATSGDVNVGVAIDTPAGLVVPNIPQTSQKSILEIASHLSNLRSHALASTLSPQHFANTTITISNIGTIAGTSMHPLLVSPQVCIGAIGRIRRVPVVEGVDGKDGGEKVVIRDVMGVSFSADHRFVDGAGLARFVRKWKMYLEEVGGMVAGLR